MRAQPVLFALLAGLLAAPLLLLSPPEVDVALPEVGVPLPTERPAGVVADTGEVDDTVTGSVRPVSAADDAALALLKDGLDALSAGNAEMARAARNALPDKSLDRRILTWAIALSGREDLSSSELAAAADDLAEWPGAGALKRAAERALARESPAAGDVVDAFAGGAPQTFEGIMLVGRALLELGRDDEARAMLSPFWRRQKLDGNEEMAFLGAFAEIVPTEDHRYRAERMLYENRIRSAERVARRAGVEELVAAWGAVIRNRSNADELLDSVPEALRGDGYRYARAKYLRRNGKFVEAADVLAAATRAGEAFIDGDAWWTERRVLSRELLDIDEPKLAYQVAAAAVPESPAAIADAAFHAGWYALRMLDDPKAAAGHFERIAAVVSGPISLSRAYYWLGRAVEAGAPGNAEAAYREAAAHGAAFYGQLAAAKLGRDTIAASHPEPSEADRARFVGREAVGAIERLERAGHGWRSDILYRDLAAELESPGELALLVAQAEARGDHYLALKIGKAAALRGIDVGALAHPVGAIPATADIGGAGIALAYAVARQESEFNVAAVSGAGARGLLQLLPGTARDMARKAGLDYSASRLTTDAAYNATLGAAFLGEQLERFDGSYILTFAGYNAGPRRAAEWVERYGDPRGTDIETAVDWIERIPYTETRNYVQRVMENYQVYKMRLTARVDIEHDLVSGR